MTSDHLTNVIGDLTRIRAEPGVLNGPGLDMLTRKLASIRDQVIELERCAIREDVRDEDALPDVVVRLDPTRRNRR